MNKTDSKIYRISGQFQQNIGPADRTVSYIDPSHAPLYTLVPPDFLYFTWDSNPTSSAWLGDLSGMLGWGQYSGKSATDNGSNAWVVSASVAVGAYGRRLAMSTDAGAFGKNGLTTDHQSDALVPAKMYNAMMSGSFSMCFWARALYDWGTNTQIYTFNDHKTILALGTRASDEAISTFEIGFDFGGATGLKPAFFCRSTSDPTNETAVTGTNQVADSSWHHYGWTFTRDKTSTLDLSFQDLFIDGVRQVDSIGRTVGFKNGLTNGGFATSGSYADLLYVGLNGYSNTEDCQVEVYDLALCSGTLSSASIAASVAAGNNAALPNILSRWFVEQPIVDKLRGYPLTVRASTSSLSSTFGNSGYLELDQLRQGGKVGCLIGPADKDIAGLFATGSYTMEAWVSCSNVDTNLRTIFAYGSSGTPAPTYFGRSTWVYVDANRNVNLVMSSGTNSTAVTGAFTDLTVPLSAWTHVQVAVQRDAVSKFFVTASCMINGVSAGTRVYPVSPFNGLSGSMWVGMKNHIIENNGTVSVDETAVWSGRLGHLKVWKEARSQADAVNVYNSERHFYDDKV